MYVYFAKVYYKYPNTRFNATISGIVRLPNKILNSRDLDEVLKCFSKRNFSSEEKIVVGLTFLHEDHDAQDETDKVEPDSK